MTNSQSNISVLSALLLTIWLMIIVDFEDHKEDTSYETFCVSCFSAVAVIFQFLSMVNSTILLMLINELSDDSEALYVNLCNSVFMYLCIHNMHGH